MDLQQKIELLGEGAQYDICASDACMGSRGAGRKRAPGDPSRWIYPAATPDGRTVRLMKVLLTNDCSNNCGYCANRGDRLHRRTGFTPEELAATFLDLNRRGIAQGLFLSSAIAGEANATMERMLNAVEIIRLKARFPGYIHLKVLPGTSFDRVSRAVELATRVSVNLEAPTPERLAVIAPGKDYHQQLLTRMRWISELRSREGSRCRGQTTQFMVGAAGESDREILTTASRLYLELKLQRIYFSAFQPVPGTPLEDAAPAPLIREHRLYQADFLFRQYAWRLDDLVFEDGLLSLREDPKLAWARRHPEWFPVEVNRADLHQLLRVPGIGPLSARRILAARSRGRFTSLEELRATRAVVRRAEPYILVNGRPAAGGAQMRLAFQAAP